MSKIKFFVNPEPCPYIFEDGDHPCFRIESIGNSVYWTDDGYTVGHMFDNYQLDYKLLKSIIEKVCYNEHGFHRGKITSPCGSFEDWSYEIREFCEILKRIEQECKKVKK